MKAVYPIADTCPACITLTKENDNSRRILAEYKEATKLTEITHNPRKPKIQKSGTKVQPEYINTITNGRGETVEEKRKGKKRDNSVKKCKKTLLCRATFAE